jgi:hypothetical protein
MQTIVLEHIPRANLCKPIVVISSFCANHYLFVLQFVQTFLNFSTLRANRFCRVHTSKQTKCKLYFGRTARPRRLLQLSLLRSPRRSMARDFYS